MFLKDEIAALQQMIAHSEVISTQISVNGIDWHIYHSLKVIIQISKALQRSDPSAFQFKYNLLRSVIFISGKIPRGKGKAPKSVLPPDNILKEDLFLQIKEVNKHLKEMKDLPPDSNFKHPYFGVLNLKMSLRFLDIHTNHHLKIMNEILKSSNR